MQITKGTKLIAATPLQVKIKRLHPDAVIPTYAKPGDAGMDLVAVDWEYDDLGNLVYGTGIAVEIPDGYVGLVFPRSSIAKYDLFQTNSVGVIDSGYRGEIKVKFKTPLTEANATHENHLGHSILKIYAAIKLTEYAKGDRIAQLIILPYPQVQFTEVDELTPTERGTGGFGSSGV